MNRFFKMTPGALALALLPVCSINADPAAPVPVTNAPAAVAPPAVVTPVPGPLPPGAGPQPKFIFSRIKVDGPYIAMTFDDGPNPKNTPKLLDLLAAKHIKATFFVVGENAVRFPDLLKRMVAEGHEVGNHSWDHPNFAKASDEKVRSEIQRTESVILSETGIKPTLLRPPYGSMTPRQRKWVHEEFGYDIILWDVDPDDWKEPGVSVVARRIITGTRSGSIILSHDIHAPTIVAMPEVFDALLAKGYKFVTVSELIAMDKGVSQPTPPQAAPSPAAANPAEVPPAVIAPNVPPSPAQAGKP